MRGLALQGLHLQMQPAQAAAAALLQLQAIAPRQLEGSQGSMQHLRRQAQVEQRRQQHVSRQAGGAIHHGQGRRAAHRTSASSSSARCSSSARRCRSHCSTSRRARRCSFWAVVTS